MIQDDGIQGVETCPDCGVAMRSKPGGVYCPLCEHEIFYPEVEWHEVEDDMPTIGW